MMQASSPNRTSSLTVPSPASVQLTTSSTPTSTSQNPQVSQIAQNLFSGAEKIASGALKKFGGVPGELLVKGAKLGNTANDLMTNPTDTCRDVLVGIAAAAILPAEAAVVVTTLLKPTEIAQDPPIPPSEVFPPLPPDDPFRSRIPDLLDPNAGKSVIKPMSSTGTVHGFGDYTPTYTSSFGNDTSSLSAPSDSASSTQYGFGTYISQFTPSGNGPSATSGSTNQSLFGEYDVFGDSSVNKQTFAEPSTIVSTAQEEQTDASYSWAESAFAQLSLSENRHSGVAQEQQTDGNNSWVDSTLPEPVPTDNGLLGVAEQDHVDNDSSWADYSSTVAQITHEATTGQDENDAYGHVPDEQTVYGGNFAYDETAYAQEAYAQEEAYAQNIGYEEQAYQDTYQQTQYEEPAYQDAPYEDTYTSQDY